MNVTRCMLQFYQCLNGHLSNQAFHICHRAASADRTASADCCWRHLPVDSAQRQQHQRGRPDHWTGGGIPHRVWHHVRPSACRQDHAQNRPPGSRHRVRDQCPADQTSGGRHWGPGTAAEGQDQMCGWADLISVVQSWRCCSNQLDHWDGRSEFLIVFCFFFSTLKAAVWKAVVIFLFFNNHSLLLLLVCNRVCATTKH